ncbi:MAG: MarR family winged helix-turn-helix transcriptional regulator [Acidimicrobiia bacterium]
MTSERKSQAVTRGEALRRIQIGLRRLTHQLHRQNDAVGSHIDLLPGDLEVLDMIGREGAQAPRDVVASTGIHPATLTGILDRLEAGGWLTRRPDPADRRRLIVEAVTNRGAEVARLYTPMSKAIGRICADYTAGDLALIVEFLEKTADAGVTATSQIRESFKGTDQTRN